jgi:hypothetical protein
MAVLLVIVCQLEVYRHLDRSNGYDRRKIRLIESNAKCRHLKNFPVKGLGAGGYLSEAPSPPKFLFWVV